MSNPYRKIETLFDRGDGFKVDTGKLRRPVFDTIAGWSVTEKIDGTNMRISFDRNDLGMTYRIAGKTDAASIPPALLKHCDELALRIMPDIIDTMNVHMLSSYTLYGEGYGPKIQNGGRYRIDQGFILFDVAVGNGIFLSEDVVTKTAVELGIPRAPLLNNAQPMSLADIVTLVRDGFASEAAEKYDPDFMAEGIVARTVEPLYDNRGERLMFKLKRKDF